MLKRISLLFVFLVMLSSALFAEIKVIEEKVFDRGNFLMSTNIIRVVEIDGVEYVVVLNKDGGSAIIKK